MVVSPHEGVTVTVPCTPTLPVWVGGAACKLNVAKPKSKVRMLLGPIIAFPPGYGLLLEPIQLRLGVGGICIKYWFPGTNVIEDGKSKWIIVTTPPGGGHGATALPRIAPLIFPSRITTDIDCPGLVQNKRKSTATKLLAVGVNPWERATTKAEAPAPIAEAKSS